MNPDRQPQMLEVARVEWVPSSPDAIEVRVFGTWHGTTAPPAMTLVVGAARVEALADPPSAERPPDWSTAFLAPLEARAILEAGAAIVEAENLEVLLPEALPGRLEPDVPGPEDEPEGVVVNPAVLAERRARRAELAEESAARRAASAEEAAETLRAQLSNLEERLAQAGAERDRLSARVDDAERRMRLAGQREEAERRRRSELEDESAEEVRAAEAEVAELRARLAGAEEITHALKLELAHARRRQDEAERVADDERAARRDLETELEETRRLLEERPESPEADELRARVVDLEARASDRESHVAELERRLAEADTEELSRLRAHAADLERRLADADPAELARLRARTADLERQVADAASAPDPAELEHLRTHAARLERRLQDADPVELARLRAHAARLERRLEEATAAGGSAASSERERLLAEQVAGLEAELERRAEAQDRVTAAIATVRGELSRVQTQVDATAGAGEMRAQLEGLDERRRALESLLSARDDELTQARELCQALEAQLREQRTTIAQLADEVREARAAASPADRRAELEALGRDIAMVRQRLQQTTSDLERRLADERRRREAAEEKLASLEQPPPAVEPVPEPPAPPAVEPEPPVASSGDALDLLVAGLRAEVAAAREQLESIGEPELPAPPAPVAPEPEPPAPAPAPERAPTIDERTAKRLESIEKELREAVPEGGSGADVIASLQHAADRLRAAAEEELALAEQEEAEDAEPPAMPTAAEPPVHEPPAPPAAGTHPPEPPAAPAPPAPEPPAPPAPEPRVEATAHRTRLEARPLRPTADEWPWLRTGLARLAAHDPGMAAQLLTELLPAQAGLVGDLTYDIVVPEAGPRRVRLASGVAQVERPEGPGLPNEVDAVVEGRIAGLAPLVAGGTGWRLKDVNVTGNRRKFRKLVRARRRPVTLVDLLRLRVAPDPGLLLAALAASINPNWTLGHTFGVEYAIDADAARFTVLVEDGAPLRVAPDGTAGRPRAASVELPTRAALLSLLAGVPGEDTMVAGDHRATAILHGWFDRARGLSPD